MFLSGSLWSCDRASFPFFRCILHHIWPAIIYSDQLTICIYYALDWNSIHTLKQFRCVVIFRKLYQIQVLSSVSFAKFNNISIWICQGFESSTFTMSETGFFKNKCVKVKLSQNQSLSRDSILKENFRRLRKCEGKFDLDKVCPNQDLSKRLHFLRFRHCQGINFGLISD